MACIYGLNSALKIVDLIKNLIHWGNIEFSSGENGCVCECLLAQFVYAKFHKTSIWVTLLTCWQLVH